VHFSESFEFVNRTKELEVLRNRVYPRSTSGTCTFLRAPSGFGKSRLTDRLIDDLQSEGPTCIVVDPSIRSKSRSERIYAWFFVQRAAEPAARRSAPNRKEFPEFAEFIRKRHWGKINWKQVYENLKGSASISGITKTCIEFLESLLKFGRSSPDSLLQEDSKFAGDVAQEYVKGLAAFRPTLFVVRECHNIDPESLRFFLSLVDAWVSVSFIFEYTTDDRNFSSDHEKIIFEAIADRSSLVIFDLLRLDLKEFRYLLQKYASVDHKIEALADLNWDGNLRIIRELKYRIMVGSTGENPKSLNLLAEFQNNIRTLSSQKKLILALAVVHVEAITREALIGALSRIDPSLRANKILEEIATLASEEGYIQIVGDKISVADEDIFDALKESPVMLPMLRLAATSLRDFYLDLINGNFFVVVRLQQALRQAVALCASTGDIFALRNLIKVLEISAHRAHNQTLYIGIVADVALSRSNLSDLEQRELCGWTAAAAYEAGNSAIAAKLVENLPTLQAYDLVLLACCYGNINRHSDALRLAEELKLMPGGSTPDIALAGELLIFLSLYALGRKSEAAAIHASLRQRQDYSSSRIFGYVLRFTELIQDFPDCTDDVLVSVDLFSRAGLKKSAAYSQAAGAMHLACMGQLDLARRLMREAAQELQPHLRDQQLLINNVVVIELLSDNPDIADCIEQLNAALFTVDDDFTRLTLYNNLFICHALYEDSDNALHVIEVIDRILADPGFGNRDIFVTVCYNVWAFLKDIRRFEKADHYKQIAFSVNLETSCYPDYWNKRFGMVGKAESKYDFLLRRKYHPDYLSHWLIDIDGLTVLKEESAP